MVGKYLWKRDILSKDAGQKVENKWNIGRKWVKMANRLKPYGINVLILIQILS